MHYSRCLLARGKARRDGEKLGKEPGADGRGRGRTIAGRTGRKLREGRQSSQAVRILGRQTWRLAHRRLSVNMCGKRRTTTERVSERLSSQPVMLPWHKPHRRACSSSVKWHRSPVPLGVSTPQADTLNCPAHSRSLKVKAVVWGMGLVSVSGPREICSPTPKAGGQS